MDAVKAAIPNDTPTMKWYTQLATANNAATPKCHAQLAATDDAGACSNEQSELSASVELATACRSRVYRVYHTNL
ncbi:hypothetical protein BAUCODRAFT_36166 [Baudoinia panamericana UAMH 10762]|uniref:Uncharacterized protein n=1 Tax=Baudoinia panamericana (strain UAMH 10762) TaxID=717646 RepID=M2N7W9_BAUPA|nr:uncharacterized protein BAUCODRAFT_36166 [Baudoinia panamericana UAMH 10762]EMC94900.1 hypothetical protein BAUCODRAFT_36166 [Baudoinia panamericana UAMH 10762]